MEPDCILGRREITLRNRTIGQVKVQWKHLSPEEATWELESKMREAYPNLFQEVAEDEEIVTSRTMLHFKGVCMSIPQFCKIMLIVLIIFPNTLC